MNNRTRPTIQDVIDIAKMYVEQGISREEAIRRAIAASTPIGNEK
ncbi:hypothetical protein [Spirosoma sp. KCTC 42546]|nr:hypothetical protein [Spirosoma sp. KCTC 42546]